MEGRVIEKKRKQYYYSIIKKLTYNIEKIGFKFEEEYLKNML